MAKHLEGDKDKVHNKRGRNREPTHRKKDYFDWTAQPENRHTYEADDGNKRKCLTWA